MVFKLFLVFTIIPFVELALLIKVGTLIGTLETIMVIIITGLAGALMVRSAGIQCLFRIRQNLTAGVLPTDELLSGLLILLAGAFLITPGLLTDAAGFVLLYPYTRNVVQYYIVKYIKDKIDKNKFNNTIDIQFP